MVIENDVLLNGWFFSVIQMISAIFLWELFPKVAGHGSERSKMTILKGGVDGFSYFSLISVILFSNQDHPCFNTGFCLIQVILQAGLTVQRKSGKIKWGDFYVYVYISERRVEQLRPVINKTM